VIGRLYEDDKIYAYIKFKLRRLRRHNNKPVADHYNYLDLLNKMAGSLIKYN